MKLKTDGMEIRQRGPLTPREAEALLWIAAGKTAWEASRILHITEHTLTAHARAAAQKLHAANRANLVALAFVRGILAPTRMLLVVIMLQTVLLIQASSSAIRPPSPARVVVRVQASRRNLANPAIWPDA